MQSGKILKNHYKIIESLGSGGFGDTYLASDLDLPGKPRCVVKHLKPKTSDPGVLHIAQRLFNREAEILYKLGKDSYQIPKLFAHFQEGTEFYLVQEYIEGQGISKELTPGKKFSESYTIALLTGILEVLAVAHQKNIIHRDIKPQNLMRRKSDNKIVLIDFGAVKEISVLTTKQPGTSTLTVAIGTPGYMPSEQSNGKPRLSSDIYAVGMVGIKALTGKEPENLPTDQDTGNILWRNEAQVSNRLANILDKMVQDYFRERYKNATEVLKELNFQTSPQPTLSLTPQLTQQPTIPFIPNTQTQPQPNKTGRKILILGSLAGGVVLILVVGSLFYFQIQQQQIFINKQFEQERLQRQKAERQREEAQREIDSQKATYEAQLQQKRNQIQEAEIQWGQERVPRQKTERLREQERNQKFVQDKFDAVAINTQVSQGYVFLSSKSGKEFTGKVTKSEIRERGNLEESGVAAWIHWSDAQTSSILFMKNSRVRVWEKGFEYRGKWYWGANDNLLYVKMDQGAQYKFTKSRLYTKGNPEKPRRSSSEQTLRNYYQTLNSYKYQSAWNSLSSELQSEGYQSYLDWWTQVKKIEVLSTKLVSEDGFNSTVDSRLRYLTKSGRKINQILRFDLVWDTGSDRWLINKIERLALLN